MHRKLIYTHVDANDSTATVGTHARPRSRLTGRFEFSRSRWPPRGPCREKRAGRPLSATFARRVCPPALRNRVNRYRPLAVGCLRTRHACNPPVRNVLTLLVAALVEVAPLEVSGWISSRKFSNNGIVSVVLFQWFRYWVWFGSEFM